MKGISLKISEEQFLAQVLDLAMLGGWRRAHFRPAQTERGWRTAVQGDGKGWPDLVLVRPPKLLMAELKVPPNTVTKEQRDWLDALAAAGVDTRIWTPADWSEIESTLLQERTT